MNNVELGYAISSEEHRPDAIIRHAQLAEEAGFTFALVSDHYHPWLDTQGESPFVWALLGGIAQSTQKLQIGTGVTAPIMRIHPAIIAQAAATVATMMPGRFFLGVGTGENLNEHILGDRWPAYQIRMEMLEEALEVIRLLWQGGTQSHYGKYYTVENAQVYTLPDTLPSIMIAAAGPESAKLAGRIGDGFINTAPDAEVIEIFEKEAGKKQLPKYGQLTVCWAESDKKAREIAHHYWANSGLPGTLPQDLPTPAHFEAAVKLVKEEDLAETIVCSSDPEKHLAAIQEYIDAGYDHVYIHQVGPDQEGFFDFYQEFILPAVNSAETARMKA